MVPVGHHQDLRVSVEQANISPGNPWIGLENGTGYTGRPSFAVTD